MSVIGYCTYDMTLVGLWIVVLVRWGVDGREDWPECGWLGRLRVSVGRAVGIVSEWGGRATWCGCGAVARSQANLLKLGSSQYSAPCFAYWVSRWMNWMEIHFSVV